MSLSDEKNKKLLNDFIAEHAPLIHKQINILKSQGKIPSHINEEDLHYHGIHGLIDALHKYDPEAAKRTSGGHKNPFAKYASFRIKGKILDHIASQDEIPKALRTRAKNIAAIEQKKASTGQEEE